MFATVEDSNRDRQASWMLAPIDRHWRRGTWSHGARPIIPLLLLTRLIVSPL